MAEPNPKFVVIDSRLQSRHIDVERIALFNEAAEEGDQPTPFTGSDLPFRVMTTATAAGTAAKVVADAEPVDNCIILLKFTSGNSAASATVAFDGGAARKITLGGDDTVAAADLTVAANGVVPLFFDGTLLHMFGSVAAEAT